MVMKARAGCAALRLARAEPRARVVRHTQELERLEADAAVYKLMGPVLVKQDLVEARANVGKRLEYINAERRARGVCVPADSAR